MNHLSNHYEDHHLEDTHLEDDNLEDDNLEDMENQALPEEAPIHNSQDAYPADKNTDMHANQCAKSPSDENLEKTKTSIEQIAATIPEEHLRAFAVQLLSSVKPGTLPSALPSAALPTNLPSAIPSSIPSVIPSALPSRKQLRKLHFESVVGEALGLSPDELVPLSNDVYSMFFLSTLPSQSFFYSILVFFIKIMLYVFLTAYLWQTRGFPPASEVPNEVLGAQFFMLPVVLLGTDEELLSTFFIYGHVRWDPKIQALYPGATFLKYTLSNVARCIDATYFFVVNTIILLQATDVLSIFLNFAALRFLLEIDNVAFRVALARYLTQRLFEDAKKVTVMELPKRNSLFRQRMNKLFLCLTFASLFVVYSAVHWGRP